MGFGVAWVSGNGGLELGNGFGDLSTLQQGLSTVERKTCSLTSNGYAAEIGSDLALGCGARGVTLADEDRSQGDVWAGLVRHKLDSSTEGRYGLVGLIVLLVDVAEHRPCVAVVRL